VLEQLSTLLDCLQSAFIPQQVPNIQTHDTWFRRLNF